MSSDEDDHMSDAILLKCGDVRPGLISSRTSQQYDRARKEKQANQRNTTMPRKQLEAVQRESGLSTHISSESKGFAMLQKMGYKPGSGIGKSGSGRVEPVAIEVKNGRAGLGRDSEMKRKAVEMNNMRSAMVAKRQKVKEAQEKSFRGRMSNRFSEMGLDKDLRTAQKACLQLDQEQGIVEPAEPFFWPAEFLSSKLKENEEEEEEEEIGDWRGDETKANVESHSNLFDHDIDEVEETPAYLEFSEGERLDILTLYLRTTYMYCIWCGTKFRDMKDLSSNCPGNSSEAHD